jgi:hypothetical protein
MNTIVLPNGNQWPLIVLAVTATTVLVRMNGQAGFNAVMVANGVGTVFDANGNGYRVALPGAPVAGNPLDIMFTRVP